MKEKCIEMEQILLDVQTFEDHDTCMTSTPVVKRKKKKQLVDNPPKKQHTKVLQTNIEMIAITCTCLFLG